MSVKKVKISELPQLPNDADATLVFMPAATTENKSYRVPLSRYENVKLEAEKLADGETQGRVAPSELGLGSDGYPPLNSLTEIFNAGALEFKEGKGVPYARYIKSLRFDTLSTNAGNNYPIGVPLMFRGKMKTEKTAPSTLYNYTGGYANRTIQAIGFIAGGCIVIFDISYGEIWEAAIVPSSQFAWNKVGSYTLPVASANTLGGIKTGAGLTTAADGTTRIADNANLPGIPTAAALAAQSNNAPIAADGTIVTQRTHRDYYRKVVDTSNTSGYGVVPYIVVRAGTTTVVNLSVRQLESGYFDEYRIEYEADRQSVQVVASDGANYYAKTIAGLTIGKWYLFTVVVRKTGSYFSGYMTVQDAL